MIFKHQNNKLKQQLIWNLIRSHITTQKHSTSSTWKDQLSLQKKIFIIWTTFFWYHHQATPKIPWKSSHASQFTKHLSYTTLEEDTILQIQKWWYAIHPNSHQYISTNNICPAYKSLSENHYELSSFLSHRTPIISFPQQKKSIKSSPRALWVYLDKDNTIPSSKEKNSHVKLVTYMNI